MVHTYVCEGEGKKGLNCAVKGKGRKVRQYRVN